HDKALRGLTASAVLPRTNRERGSDKLLPLLLFERGAGILPTAVPPKPPFARPGKIGGTHRRRSDSLPGERRGLPTGESRRCRDGNGVPRSAPPARGNNAVSLLLAWPVADGIPRQNGRQPATNPSLSDRASKKQSELLESSWQLGACAW